MYFEGELLDHILIRYLCFKILPKTWSSPVHNNQRGETTQMSIGGHLDGETLRGNSVTGTVFRHAHDACFQLFWGIYLGVKLLNHVGILLSSF